MEIHELPENGQFRVAFSFAGEQRERVRAIVEAVEQKLGPSTVFLDEWSAYYLASDDGDQRLQQLYDNGCDPAVVCVSKHYGDKPLTRIEHRAKGQLEDAKKAYEEDLRISRQLAEHDPGNEHGNTIC